MNDAAFASFVLGLRSLFSTVGMQVMWETSRPSFPADFIRFIDKIIAEAQVIQPTDALASWKAAIAVKRKKIAA